MRERTTLISSCVRALHQSIQSRLASVIKSDSTRPFLKFSKKKQSFSCMVNFVRATLFAKIVHRRYRKYLCQSAHENISSAITISWLDFAFHWDSIVLTHQFGASWCLTFFLYYTLYASFIHIKHQFLTDIWKSHKTFTLENKSVKRKNQVSNCSFVLS